MLRRMMLARTVAPPSGQSFIFNPSDKNANITLSGGDKIASTVVGGGHYFARADKGKSSGKWQFEFVVDAVTSGVGNIAISLCELGFPPNTVSPHQSPGSGVSGATLWTRLSSPAARYYYDSSARYDTLSTSGTILATGDICTFTVDFSTKEIAFYRNGALVHTKTVSQLSPGSYTYAPMVKLWGGAGNPTTIRIPNSLTHPVAGFSPWA